MPSRSSSALASDRRALLGYTSSTDRNRLAQRSCHRCSGFHQPIEALRSAAVLEIEGRIIDDGRSPAKVTHLVDIDQYEQVVMAQVDGVTCPNSCGDSVDHKFPRQRFVAADRRSNSKLNSVQTANRQPTMESDR